MLSRRRLGNMLFTMSMRMCSLASRVHGAHSRNTMLNSTHWSSSQEFDEVSKTLRTVALTAETTTAARINQATRLPIQVVVASIIRVAGSNALSNASRAPTCLPPPAGPCNPAVRRFCFCFKSPRLGLNQASYLNPMAAWAVNGEVGLRPGQTALRAQNTWVTNPKFSVKYGRAAKAAGPRSRGAVRSVCAAVGNALGARNGHVARSCY